MIIKSHVRAGYRAAADYLKDQGENETTRLVEISDPDAQNLDKAFHNMWTIASNTRAKKPLHHISINPYKDERLTDEQVQKIVKRCEEKYGYNSGDHQRVIVEHVKDGRQHFHVFWNRVSLKTHKVVWPGEHWKKSKQICREMEVELSLKRPVPRKFTKSRKRYSPISRPRRYYAGMLSEPPALKRKKGEGKTDGAGGGVTSAMSALKTNPKPLPLVKKYSSKNAGKGNGPERRHKNMWVAVERRRQGPKS